MSLNLHCQPISNRHGSDAFRALLPRYFQYEFVDGEDDCDAAPGIGEVYPGPYLSYYNVPSSTKVDDAHVYLHSIIAEDGPFDAVMGFSQASTTCNALRDRTNEDREEHVLRVLSYAIK